MGAQLVNGVSQLDAAAVTTVPILKLDKHGIPAAPQLVSAQLAEVETLWQTTHERIKLASYMYDRTRTLGGLWFVLPLLKLITVHGVQYVFISPSSMSNYAA